MLELTFTGESQDSENHHRVVKFMQNANAKRPIVGLGVVVWKNDQVLLVRRGKAPRKNQWSIPGGAQELGETVKQGAMREVKEETGLDIKLVGLIDVVDGIFKDEFGVVGNHYTLVDLAAVWTGGEAVASSDALEIRWATISEAESLIEWHETLRVIHQSVHVVKKDR